MIAQVLDSRASLGSDMERRPFPRYPYRESSAWTTGYSVTRTIRVVLGCLGNDYRMTAPQLDIVTDGRSIAEAWAGFLAKVRVREDAPWLTFDVGPTRRHEIEEGLDAPENEDWAEPTGDRGAE